MEFKRLADVEALTEIPEGANAFVEVDGEIKRVPGEGLGGAGGFKTAVIKSSDYDETLAYLSGGNGGRTALDVPTFSCVNMTFNEAYTTLENGEVLKAIFMAVEEGPTIFDLIVSFMGTYAGEPCIYLFHPLMQVNLYWTANGFSAQAPGDGDGK